MIFINIKFIINRRSSSSVVKFYQWLATNDAVIIKFCCPQAHLNKKNSEAIELKQEIESLKSQWVKKDRRSRSHYVQQRGQCASKRIRQHLAKFGINCPIFTKNSNKKGRGPNCSLLTLRFLPHTYPDYLGLLSHFSLYSYHPSQKSAVCMHTFVWAMDTRNREMMVGWFSRWIASPKKEKEEGRIASITHSPHYSRAQEKWWLPRQKINFKSCPLEPRIRKC